MSRWLRECAPEARGQTLVLIGIVLFVLLAAGAMAVDVGGVMWSRGAEQNAADAAALAGVRALPGTPDLAREIAQNYTANNGFTNGVDGVTVTAEVFKIFNDNDALRVTITRVVPPGLRAAVGAGNIEVPAQATAIVAPAIPMCDIWPWGIEENVMLYDPLVSGGSEILAHYDDTYGQKVVLKVPSNKDVAPGNFLGLAPGSSTGANDYRNNIKYGSCITNTETIRAETGNMTGPTSQGVLTQADSAIKQSEPCYNATTKSPDSVFWQVNEGDPYTSPFTDADGNHYVTTEAFALGAPCPLPGGTVPPNNGNTGPPSATNPFPSIVLPSTSRVGIVPILEAGAFAASNGGSGTVPIRTFAAFYLIGLETVGSKDYVVGAFLKEVVVKGGTPDYGGDLSGPVGYFLWQ